MSLHLTFYEDCKRNILHAASLSGDEEALSLAAVDASKNISIHAACILLLLAKARGPKLPQRYNVTRDGTFVETLATKVKSSEYKGDFFKWFGMGEFLDGSRGTRKDGCGAFPHVELITRLCPPEKIFINIRSRKGGRSRPLIGAEMLHQFALKLESANGFWTGCKYVKELIAETKILQKQHSSKGRKRISTIRIGNESSQQRWERLLWYHVRRRNGEKDAINLLQTHGDSNYLWNCAFPVTGDSPLLGAIASRKERLTSFLLSNYKVEVNQTNRFGQSAVLRAAALDDCPRRFFLKEVLARKPILSDCNSIGLGFIHELVFPNPMAVDPLWDYLDRYGEEYGFSICGVTKDGFLPVSIAIERKAMHYAITQLLPSKPELLGIRDLQGETLAYKAFVSGDWNIFRDIVNKLQKNGIRCLDPEMPVRRRKLARSALYQYVKTGSVSDISSEIKRLKQNGQEDEINIGLSEMVESPLHAAVKNCNFEAVALLLKAGANPFLYDHHGRTARELLLPKFEEGTEKNEEIESLLDDWEQKHIDHEFESIHHSQFG